MADRRKIRRIRKFQDGKILLEGLELPCTIRERSENGACLEVRATRGIPDIFQLAAASETRNPAKVVTCRVVWRDYTRLGVHFRSAAISTESRYEQMIIESWRPAL
jgi:PilZ domain